MGQAQVTPWDVKVNLGQIKDLLSSSEDYASIMAALCEHLKESFAAKSVFFWYLDKTHEPKIIAKASPHDSLGDLEVYIFENLDFFTEKGPKIFGQSQPLSSDLPQEPLPGHNGESWIKLPALHGNVVTGGFIIAHTCSLSHLQTDFFYEMLGVLAGDFLYSWEVTDGFLGGPSHGKESRAMVVREGVSLNRGFGEGPIVIHKRTLSQTSKTGPVDPVLEEKKFENALKKMEEEISRLVQIAADQNLSENLDILQAFEMIAFDPSWQEKVRERIYQGQTAHSSTQKVFWGLIKDFKRSQTKRIQDRVSDLQDVCGRILAHLQGEETENFSLEAPFILMSRYLGPGELMGYAQFPIQGLVLEEGLSTSHVSILAKNLKIPILTGVKNLLPRVENGDIALLDGHKGCVYIRPTPEARQEFTNAQTIDEKRAHALSRVLYEPPITKDGVRASLNINCGLPEDLKSLQEYMADGVGLFRTEIPFMLMKKLPKVGEQTQLYQEILAKAEGKPVTFRTLDIGADKPLPYLNLPQEENPMMGWRAIRMGLDRPGILKQQLRALLAAGPHQAFRIMLPMVAEVEELMAVRTLLQGEIQRCQTKGLPLPRKVELGVMLEIPALAWQLEALLPEVDFLSVGSNDLFQFFFASDRMNQDTASRYDRLSPSFLNFLAYIAEQCHRHQVPVSVCGEMAATPLEAMALIGVGITHLSMNPTCIPAVKHMLRQLDTEKLQALLETLLQTPRRSVRSDLAAFAEAEKIELFSH